MAKRQVVPIDSARISFDSSFEAQILDHLDGLFRFALRLTRDSDAAEDLAQETALRAWERRDTILQNLRAWLFQTVYHTFISNQRRRVLRREVSPGSREDVTWLQKLEKLPDPLPGAIAIEDVRRAMELLSRELRAVAWLSDAEDFTLKEIAQILDWPIGTVASRLWRARHDLRELLSAYGPSGREQR